MKMVELKRSSTQDEPNNAGTGDDSSGFAMDSPGRQSPDFRKEVNFGLPKFTQSMNNVIPAHPRRAARHDSNPLIKVGRLKRHDSPVEQSPLLMPDHNHKRKPRGNESERSNSPTASSQSAVFCKPKLGGATPSRGFASRMAGLRPKFGFGGNS